MLAIVIPYYKLTFFESTLLSLQNQTNKQFTVYIGDDASPENPESLLEKFKNSFQFYYKRFDSNIGSVSLTKQWHRCLHLCKEEEWVVILCDDDTISNNFVAEFYNHLDEINQLEINVIRYATIVIDEHGEQISKVHEHPKLETSTDFLMRKFKGGTRSSLSEFVFRKFVLDEVKFKNFPLAWYSDYLAVMECSKFGDIYTINNSIMFFRLSGLNITSKNDNLVLKNIATFNFYYYLLLEKNNFFNNYQKEILYSLLEKTFLDNKKIIIFWFSLTKLYVVRIQVRRYFNFIYKVKESLLKINK